ncbi:MAG: 4-alpha-glucanotransferase [Methanobacteriota archaeon]|nr:MAG: 4-alpha-glucanotransferase [Euryarchaeota archaeon]
MRERGSGLLLHVTSLPGAYGIGDFGPEAYRFADFLADTRQRYWQILPLNPTDSCCGNSPYHSISAFAGSTLLISPEGLVKEGLVGAEALEPVPRFSPARVDYPVVAAYKRRIFDRAFEVFRKKGGSRDYAAFCSENAYWLDDYALFVTLHDRFGGRVWGEWPSEIRDRDPAALAEVAETAAESIEREKYLQFLFYRQWSALRRYCAARGISFIGDIPIYVTYHSVDCWTVPEIFNFDGNKRPITVAGVPPDYFSSVGQLWGNPVYRWDVLAERGYDWWMKRIEHNLKLFDAVRIDHFRGFAGYWEVSAGEKTAVRGRWRPGPGAGFFTRLTRQFPHLSLIAEDLGVITPDVEELKEQFGFPGMKVLLFAFGENLPENPYIPHNYLPNCVVYTGTHDNNTAEGWFAGEASPGDRERLSKYIGRTLSAGQAHTELVRLAMMSVAETVIVPVQDLLGLAADARMNTPGISRGNWEWRLAPGSLTGAAAHALRTMTTCYGRA